MFDFWMRWLFLFAARGTPDVGKAAPRCSVPAPIEQKHCLMQRQFHTAAVHIQTVEHHVPQGAEEDPALIFGFDFTPFDAQVFTIGKDKTSWTGDEINIDFDLLSPDMEFVTMKYAENWNVDPATSSTTRMIKPYLEVLILPKIGGQRQIVADGIRMFGFNRTTFGLANVANNQYWTAKPGTKGASLVYLIQILHVPEISKWKYNVQFTSPPPQSMTIFPTSRLTRRSEAGHCYIAFVCTNDVECGDKSIAISSISLHPKEEDMPKPEELHPTMPPKYSNGTTMDNQSRRDLITSVKNLGKS